MIDDDQVTSAYGYLSRLGVREEYILVLIIIDEILLDNLIENTDSEDEKDILFNIDKVRQYRNEYKFYYEWNVRGNGIFRIYKKLPKHKHKFIEAGNILVGGLSRQKIENLLV